MFILVSHCFHHLSEILYRIYLCTSFAYNIRRECTWIGDGSLLRSRLAIANASKTLHPASGWIDTRENGESLSPWHRPRSQDRPWTPVKRKFKVPWWWGAYWYIRSFFFCDKFILKYWKKKKMNSRYNAARMSTVESTDYNFFRYWILDTPIKFRPVPAVSDSVAK